MKNIGPVKLMDSAACKTWVATHGRRVIMYHALSRICHCHCHCHITARGQPQNTTIMRQRQEQQDKRHKDKDKKSQKDLLRHRRKVSGCGEHRRGITLRVCWKG